MDSVKGEKYIKLIKEFLTIKSGKILKGTRFNLHLILDKTVLKESLYMAQNYTFCNCNNLKNAIVNLYII